MAKLIIRRVAENQHLNQSQLQIKAGVTSQLLYRYWHNFTKSVELEQLEKIAKALSVQPGELIVSDSIARNMDESEEKAKAR